MSSTTLQRPAAAVSLVAPAAALLALAACAGLLRLQALGAALWLDEAQAVNIARAPLHAIPGLLRVDGSPPLYYAVLHVWTSLAGASEARVHLLSAGFAALCVPLGFWAGNRVAGLRAAWIAALLLATNPLLTRYADQARMYTLLAALSLAVVALTAEVAVHRRRWAAPALAVGLGATLLTHNWGFFLLAGCAAGLLAAWQLAGRPRALALDAAIAIGGALVIYAPWVPHLVDQVRHTGAPWSVHPSLHGIVTAVAGAVGDGGPAAVLLLVGGAGVLAARRTPSILVLASVCVTALVTAVAFCEVSLAWAPRYLALLAGPLTVLGAAGLAQMRGLGVAAAALIVALTLGVPHARVLDNKTNVAMLARAANHHLRAGDLVISTQPEQLPALTRYLRPGLRYATVTGIVSRPQIMDWRRALERVRASSPRHDLLPLVRALPPGRRVLLVNPSTTPQGLSSAWAKVVRNRKRQWTRALRHEHGLRRVWRFARDPNAHEAAAQAVLLRRV
jgi:hypothetical protein